METKENTEFISGFVYKKDKYDLLGSCTSNGHIYLFNLNKRILIKDIYIKNTKFFDIILLNIKYILVTDSEKNSLKIIDIENGKVISKYEKIKYIKKMYGKSLISSDDNIIKLWTVKNKIHKEK